ncbi:MAG TPA: nitrous oxide reductase accessory protein NosL [Chitinophagaceae bacterium]|nr:nitrous oxide reductase accessory protein NosL [Chitinophagaceae bacterium]
MNTNKLKKVSRIILFICGIALIAVLYVPLWNIDLNAPQYPEGLSLSIYANRLGGNVDIINGLNHYIGMKTLHEKDFVEFKVLPYCIMFFAVAFILTALLNNRKTLYTLLMLFVSFGIIAMVDFWRWEYNYGHDLNPEAAIKVPGMSYQPPLIGYKQLLNFSAYSLPDTGGWIFIGAGALLLFLVIAEIKDYKKAMRSNNLKLMMPLFLMIALSSCTVKPEAINIGKDNCYFCKMAISDNRFGGEIISKKGKIFKFDDGHCLLSFLQSKTLEQNQIADVYLVDFSGDHQLLKADKSFILKSDSLRSPMNGNIAAFASEDSMKKIVKQYSGDELTWNQLNK